MTQTSRITPRYDGVSRLTRMAAIYALRLCVLTHRHIFPRCSSTDKILQLWGLKRTSQKKPARCRLAISRSRLNLRGQRQICQVLHAMFTARRASRCAVECTQPLESGCRSDRLSSVQSNVCLRYSFSYFCHVTVLAIWVFLSLKSFALKEIYWPTKCSYIFAFMCRKFRYCCPVKLSENVPTVRTSRQAGSFSSAWAKSAVSCWRSLQRANSMWRRRRRSSSSVLYLCYCS